MSLKFRLYPDGPPNRVARPNDRGTESLYARRKRKVGTETGTRLSGIGGLLVLVGTIAFIWSVMLNFVLTSGVDPSVPAQARPWVPVNWTQEKFGSIGKACY